MRTGLITSKLAEIFRMTPKLRGALAFALALPLFCALAPPASAGVHAYWPAPQARLHVAYARQIHAPRAWQIRAPRIWHVRASRAWQVRAPRAWASTARRPVRFYAATRRHLAYRVATLPPMRFQPAQTGGSSVVAEAMRFVGAGNVTGMRGAWCADYASMILRRTGHRALAGRSVSAAFAYGPRVGQPKPGDLVVLNTRRGYAQHVGFFAGWQNGQMVMVSGNWGHRVSRALIPRSAVAAFIRV
jgi:uncharacterized protein (TIGR02594 family)